MEKEKSLLIFCIQFLTARPFALATDSFSKGGYFYQAFVTRKISFKKYVLGKILFANLCTVVYHLALIPYIIKKPEVIILTYAMGAIYYLTFSLELVLLQSSFDRDKLYLNGSPLANPVSFSFSKQLAIIPLFAPLLSWQ